jgi:hypothetical protein
MTIAQTVVEELERFLSAEKAFTSLTCDTTQPRLLIRPFNSFCSSLMRIVAHDLSGPVQRFERPKLDAVRFEMDPGRGST